MGKRQSMVRRLSCAGLAALCLGAVGGPVAARADTPDIIAPQNSPADASDGWQAGTCVVEPCSPSTPGSFYTQAAGHPPFGFTQFIVKHTTVGPLEDTVGVLQDVRVAMPGGL